MSASRHRAGAPRQHMVLLETVNGRAFVEGPAEHCLAVMRRYQALSDSGFWLPGRPAPAGSMHSVGGAVYDVEDVLVEGFGRVPEVGAEPYFEQLYPVYLWQQCQSCERPMCPGQVVTRRGDCSTCVYARDPESRAWRFLERPYEPPPPKKKTTSGRTTA